MRSDYPAVRHHLEQARSVLNGITTETDTRMLQAIDLLIEAAIVAELRQNGNAETVAIPEKRKKKAPPRSSRE